jgi:hypothetical protein
MSEKAIHTFLEFCGRYRPDFAKQVKGATEAEVREFEALVKAPLAPEHRAFLLAMGNTAPGTFGPFLKFERFNLAAAREYYALDHQPPHPADVAFLLTFESDSPYDYLLQLGGGPEERRPVVMLGWVDGQWVKSPIRNSLPGYLYREAMYKLRIPLLPSTRRLGEREHNPQLLAQVQRTAAELGFQPVPFDDDNPYHFDRSDAALSLSLGAEGSSSLSLWAGSDREAGHLAQLFCDHAQLSLFH